MALGNESKGYEWTISTGPSGAEQTLAVNLHSIEANNNMVALFETGSRTAANIKEGNQVVTGVLTRAIKDDRLLAQVLGNSSLINFVGINNGSSTHISTQKTATSSNTELAPGSWSGTEFTNGEYDEIEADDASDYNLSTSTSPLFPAVLLKFDNVGTESNIDFLTFELVGFGTGTTNGFEVLAYDFDATAWVSLGTSDAAAAQGSLTVTLSSPGAFIEVTTADVYFLVRSRASSAGSATTVNIDYTELRIHNTTARAGQEDFSIVSLGSNSSGTLTLTIANAKFDTWSIEFDNSGETIEETVTYIAKTITTAQT